MAPVTDTDEPPNWFRRIANLYRRLDEELAPHTHLCRMRAVCCDFRRTDHRLYATELEVRYALALRARRGASIPEAESDGLCPFWHDGLCHAREERPLGCRTYFCDPSWRERGEAMHARYHEALRRVCDEERVPYEYAPWVERWSALGHDSTLDRSDRVS